MSNKFVDDILAWYSLNKRNLPWRNTKDPYKIWVCEVIFQQTRINQGLEYYNRFIQRFPDVVSLSEAEEDEVLKFWEGLGYYSRARNLHFSAKYIVNTLQGVFPSSFKEILTLKGVGPYTAAAISSICFQEKVPAIDGNALRVYARLNASFLNISHSSTAEIFSLEVQTFLPKESGDYNQAIMELGALICTPKNPDCENCPVQKHCKAFTKNLQKELPIKEKTLKKKKVDIDYILYYNNEGLLISKRNDQSIWKNLYEINTIDLQRKASPFHSVKHQLTHKTLNINFFEEKKNKEFLKDLEDQQEYKYIKWSDLNKFAFPKPIGDFLYDFEKNIIFEKNK